MWSAPKHSAFLKAAEIQLGRGSTPMAFHFGAGEFRRPNFRLPTSAVGLSRMFTGGEPLWLWSFDPTWHRRIQAPVMCTTAVACAVCCLHAFLPRAGGIFRGGIGPDRTACGWCPAARGESASEASYLERGESRSRVGVFSCREFGRVPGWSLFAAVLRKYQGTSPPNKQVVI